jgi:hypothetical protein
MLNVPTIWNAIYKNNVGPRRLSSVCRRLDADFIVMVETFWFLKFYDLGVFPDNVDACLKCKLNIEIGLIW